VGQEKFFQNGATGLRSFRSIGRELSLNAPPLSVMNRP
jgi:hypothetical protein